MTIHFSRAAENEFQEAITYYNSQREGLGFEFAAEVKKALERIEKYPSAWPAFSKRTRRCRILRFPYGILFSLVENRIVIIAVMHLRKNPVSWKERSKGTV